ncbi:ABC transporter permease, partial [Candidatus Saccharibacteria bacterium]|nr:ABC transporter permease [Candidatus Saccharibacteria bacterium]
MNVFRYELKSSRFSTTLWIIAILSLVALYMSIYPAFAKDATAILDILKNLPPAAKQITGLGTDLELFSFLGFLASIFPFITLIGAIQASVMGFTILSKETVAKTTDFLLTKPKTRTSIFWQKIASSAVMLL